jgi:DNA (cytosine-5)-methyltransferase 1
VSGPTLLDLFCCEGGAGAGYARAGFTVTGVDINAQHRYPYAFHQGDALEFVLNHGHRFDVIHASPPCQAYSITRHTHTRQHPDLLAPTRAALRSTGRPYVIENVEGAPLLNPLRLCGSEFDLVATDDDGTPLRLQRHRLFESNVFLTGNGGCRHDPRVDVAGAYSGGSSDRRHAREVRRGGYTPAKHVREQLLGIEWMTLHGLSQSIPPAYTEHLGAQLIEHLALV